MRGRKLKLGGAEFAAGSIPVTPGGSIFCTLSGPESATSRPFHARAHSGPGCPPRPAEARCIYTLDGLSTGFHNSMFFIILAL